MIGDSTGYRPSIARVRLSCKRSTTAKDGSPRRLYVALPGHAEEEGRALDEATINRVRVPQGFYDAVKAALRRGATILVTQSSVGESAGQRLTIMDAVAPRP